MVNKQNSFFLTLLKLLCDALSSVLRNLERVLKLIFIWSPVGLAEELRFFVHVLLDLSPVDVPEQRADVGRAEHISK